MDDSQNLELRRAVKFVAIANLVYFGFEVFFAYRAGSVSLFADSIDFLEDASINFLILFALQWSARSRAYIGKVLALFILIPSFATLWIVFSKLASRVTPDPNVISLVGFGALLVNGICALKLAKHRHHSGSLTKAAFLSSRNDLFANVAIIFAGFFTTFTNSFIPDLIVGLGIAAMNADAAKQVWKASEQELSKMNAGLDP